MDMWGHVRVADSAPLLMKIEGGLAKMEKG